MFDVIRLNHSDFFQKKLQDFQEANRDLSLKDVSHIKKGFRTRNNKTEWIWVKLSKFDDNKKIGHGTIDNDTVNSYVSFGDKVSFEYSEIIEIFK